jgi:hypothetical protein
MKPYSGSDIHMEYMYSHIFPVLGKADLRLMQSMSNSDVSVAAIQKKSCFRE